MAYFLGCYSEFVILNLFKHKRSDVFASKLTEIGTTSSKIYLKKNGEKFFIFFNLSQKMCAKCFAIFFK